MRTMPPSAGFKVGPFPLPITPTPKVMQAGNEGIQDTPISPRAFSSSTGKQPDISGVLDFKSLRCPRAGCSFSWSFTHVDEWRAHADDFDGIHCRGSGNRFYCCFPRCAKNYAQFSTRQDAAVHEDTDHTVWPCWAEDCSWVFTNRRKLVGHVLLQHLGIEKPEELTRQLWMAQRPVNDQILQDSSLFVDLGRWPQLSSSSTTTSGASRALEQNVVQFINTQVTSLQQFIMEPSLPLEEHTRRQLNDSMERFRSSLPTSLPEPIVRGRDRSVSALQPFQGPSLANRARSRSAEPTIPEPSTSTQPPKINTSTTIPWRPRQSTALGSWPFTTPNTPRSSHQIRFRRTSSNRLEPLQEMHLSAAIQRRYFQQMQDCCVESAFNFYLRHRLHLDTVTDRKGRRLCITTHGRQISSKTDLTLPQWTHLLRRLSDAKGLKRTMVSRIESFNGEIQPVDEVRHACSKNKEKSDRDLLALVQNTRCFCWQLRDWEKCEQLDDLYGTIEEEIAIAKREREDEGLRPQRQSLTWPPAAKS